jgi:hypothetical protein
LGLLDWRTEGGVDGFDGCRRCARNDGQTFLPGEANNFYILVIFATQTKRVIEEVFIEAGQADAAPSG